MRLPALLSILLFFCGSLFSATIHVPVDQPTIQSGIDASISGDTVLVANGIYIGDGNRDIDFKGKGIVLKSENGASATIIDCQGSLSDRHRGFTFHSGEDTSAVVDGFTILGGFTVFGGAGIKCDSSSSPKILNNTIIRNVDVQGGGGIFCLTSSPIISNNTITDNSGDELGGGILCGRNSNPTINNNTIMRNSSKRGAGISCIASSNPSISNNMISNNIGSGSGGGIYCDSDSNPFISNNTIKENSSFFPFSGFIFGSGGGIACLRNSNPTISFNSIIGNSVGEGGGGIICVASNPNIVNNSISDNSGGDGGGIFCFDNSSPNISNNIISGNSATTFGKGGGIILHSSDPNISNNTFIGNSADNGGAIFFSTSSSTISNNTFSGNSATTNGAVLFLRNISFPLVENNVFAFNSGNEPIWCDSTSNSALSCCDVFGNTGGDWIGCIADQAGINGNFSLDPLFCDTAASDFQIDAFSPCAAEHNSCGVQIGALGVGCFAGTLCADANGDGLVTQEDLDFLIEYYFAFGPAPDPLTAVDLNIDGVVDLGDIVYLAQFLSGIGPAPCAGSEPPPSFDPKKKPEGHSAGL